MRPTLSVILPTYNERQNVPILMERFEKLSLNWDLEVLIVDDNSPDGTSDVARTLAKTRPWLRVIQRMHDKGLSQAVMEGFSAASGDVLVVMDADLQHDEQVLSSFISAFESGAELVVGSRKAAGGGVENWSIIRKFVSSVATKMAEIVLKKNVSDPMSGFFAIHRKLYKNTAEKINPRGFKILLEFLVHAPAATQISEIGYVFKGRQHGESKLTSDVMIDYIETLYELKFGKVVPIRFLKYVSTGLVGVFVNQISVLIFKYIFDLQNSTALAFGIELSILSNFILNNYWTFREVRFKKIPAILRGGLIFNSVCLAGAAINYATGLWLISEFKISIYAANFVGILLATFWNYLINSQVTWTSRKKLK